ncbi:MAG TPA: TolC family protein, partial [Kofleriaceae bacterium]|nr:TolC family protein [Kofleriaceae bacterium]
MTACAGGPRSASYGELTRLPGAPPARAAAEPPTDAALAAGVRLADVIAAVRARAPELAEGRARVEADLARADAAGALPDPELVGEIEHVPLRRPYAVDEADGLMLSIRQMFPAAGSRGARAQAVRQAAVVTAWELAARERDLVQRAAQAYYEYAGATAELALHGEHIGLGQAVVEALRAAHRAGRASQQDVLAADVEAQRLHGELIAVRQRLASARALLNGLMDRPIDAPLGPPEALPPPAELDAAALGRRQAEARPELQAAAAGIRRAEADQRAASREASRPSLMLEGGYVAMPMEDQV